jgi:hypothetical protein
MPGLNVASSSSGRSSLRSPPPVFADFGSMLGNPSARTTSRSRLLVTAFHSPAAGIPFQALPRRGHSSRPITSLSRLRLYTPVDFTLSSSPALCFWRGTSSRNARSVNPRLRSRLLAALLLPFRVFLPVRIVALEAVCLRKAYPSRRPDFPSLPDARSITITYAGSPFQARYLPPGSLFLEPLGTNIIMLLIGFYSKQKVH